MEIAGWLLAGLSIFLMADAVLAIFGGKRYMLWGLDRTPGWYRNVIERASELSPTNLMAIKLAEAALGFGLFWLASKLMW